MLKAAELGADAPQVLGLFEAFEGSEHIVNCRDFCVAVCRRPALDLVSESLVCWHRSHLILEKLRQVAWRSKSALDEKLGFAFDVFDVDGSGSIDEVEFGTLMDTVCPPMPSPS